MLERTLHDIPQMPARRTRVAELSDAPESLVLVPGTVGYTTCRVDEVLHMSPDSRVWHLEPIDDFPHFERDMRRCTEHPIWRRPGMELSGAELAVLVPVARMLAATERWTTGAFASTGLPSEEERLQARESNLGHVVGMLDIVDAHYDKLLTLCGGIDAMRALVRLIFGHDLPEFPRGDHSRSEIAKQDPRERMEAAYRKQCEEEEAVDMIASRVRGEALAQAVRDPMERYARGKPKMYTLQTAAQWDLLSFLVKFIDLSQGTEHGCERIFPHYARQTDETRSHLQRHLDDGVEELRVIGMKIMRLVWNQLPRHARLAAETLATIADPSISLSRGLGAEASWASGFAEELYAESLWLDEEETRPSSLAAWDDDPTYRDPRRYAPHLEPEYDITRAHPHGLRTAAE